MTSRAIRGMGRTRRISASRTGTCRSGVIWPCRSGPAAGKCLADYSSVIQSLACSPRSTRVWWWVWRPGPRWRWKTRACTPEPAGGESAQRRIPGDVVPRTSYSTQRNPRLRAILRDGVEEPERQIRAIETIERNADSLTQIVEDVLDVSRIVSGKMRLDVQPVDVGTMIRHAVDAVLPSAGVKGVAVRTVIDPDAGPVAGDPERLQQIIWNLLSNAIKFTCVAGRSRCVSSALRPASPSSSAIPVSASHRSSCRHVFERFRQADSGASRVHGGLGLGLSIVKQLVELHGGTIQAESEGATKGASFTVKLPIMLARPAGNEDTGRARPSAAGQVTSDLTSIDVLVVDDDRDALGDGARHSRNRRRDGHLGQLRTRSARRAVDRHAACAGDRSRDADHQRVRADHARAAASTCGRPAVFQRRR